MSLKEPFQKTRLFFVDTYRKVSHSALRSLAVYKCASLQINQLCLQWKAIIWGESGTLGLRTDSICLTSWRTSGWGPWSKQQGGRMTLAAAFCTYRGGKLHLLKLENRIWQWLESEVIRLDWWVLASSLEYLRLVWKKSVRPQHWLWLTCLVKLDIWTFCMTGMLQNSQSSPAIVLQHTSAWLCILQKANLYATFE